MTLYIMSYLIAPKRQESDFGHLEGFEFMLTSACSDLRAGTITDYFIRVFPCPDHFNAYWRHALHYRKNVAATD